MDDPDDIDDSENLSTDSSLACFEVADKYYLPMIKRWLEKVFGKDMSDRIHADFEIWERQTDEFCGETPDVPFDAMNELYAVFRVMNVDENDALAVQAAAIIARNTSLPADFEDMENLLRAVVHALLESDGMDSDDGGMDIVR